MKGYKELMDTVRLIQASGMIDTSQEAAVEYQDMIAKSNADQLRELANSEYKEAFYRLYDVACGVCQTIRFFCKNSEKVLTLIEERDAFEEQAEYWERSCKAERAAYEETNRQLNEARRELEAVETAYNEENSKHILEVEKLEQEVKELKAKLYDMMTK